MYAADAVSVVAHMRMKVTMSKQMSVLLKGRLEETAVHWATARVAELIAAAIPAAKLDDTDHREWHDSEPPPYLE